MQLMVTGGCGFIGSAVIRHLLRETAHGVVNVDKMTYAASQDALELARDDARHTLVRADIADADAMARVFATYAPDAVMHLAAESHVDRSIDAPGEFIRTNVVGTFVLLDAARRYWCGLSNDARARFRFHHISTDEVFGALGSNDPPFTEATAYDPRSPYSASKAGSDHLVRSWFHTYGLPTMISNTTNNYGPWQFPEKLIPLITLNALNDEVLPIYGDGRNQRDWLYVDDHAQALVAVLERGVPGETYAIGAQQPRSNLQVVNEICALVDELAPSSRGPRADRLIRFVGDRPGHDFRYEIDASRARARLGWAPRHDFASGLRRTVQWYIDHPAWWSAIRKDRYAGQRIGRVSDGLAGDTNR